MRNRKILVALMLIAALTLGNVMAVAAAGDTSTATTENNRVGFMTVQRPPVNENDRYYPQNDDNDNLNDTGNDNDLNDLTGLPGLFRLDVVPQFNFGLDHNILGRPSIFHAVLPRGSVNGGAVRDIPYYVQLTDDRGTLQGWTLSAQLVRQFGDPTGAPTAAPLLHPRIVERMAAAPAVPDPNNPARGAALNPRVLTGSTITLRNFEARTNNVDVVQADGTIETVIMPEPALLPAGTTGPGGPGSQRVLTLGTARLIAGTAATEGTLSNQGQGVTLIRFGNVVSVGGTNNNALASTPAERAANSALSSVELYIPTSVHVLAGIYTAGVMWTLSSGSGNPADFN